MGTGMCANRFSQNGACTLFGSGQKRDQCRCDPISNPRYRYRGGGRSGKIGQGVLGSFLSAITLLFRSNFVRFWNVGRPGLKLGYVNLEGSWEEAKIYNRVGGRPIRGSRGRSPLERSKFYLILKGMLMFGWGGRDFVRSRSIFMAYKLVRSCRNIALTENTSMRIRCQVKQVETHLLHVTDLHLFSFGENNMQGHNRILNTVTRGCVE